MLAGKNNEEKIWNYLKGAGLNDFGTAGLMGNLYAESGLIPNNVENLYEKRLGVTDASYTAAVDSGKYQFFATDKAGYALLNGHTAPARQSCWTMPNAAERASAIWKCSLIS